MPNDAEFGPNLLRHWIDRAAGRDPDKAYIVSVNDRRTISYRQLQQLTRQIAAFLAARGLRNNDRVALLAGNSIEHIACYIGVMAYGATICTIHVEMNRGHLARILPTLDPRLVVFDAELALGDLLARTSAPCLPLGLLDDHVGVGFYRSVTDCEPTDVYLATTCPQDDACILFTSGTSAQPKGVVLTFRELLANVEPTADGLGLTADDRI
jgi:long-subunit acyl-CoA synthetase (AMP-forming)